MKMKTFYKALLLGLVAVFHAGCATRYVVKTHGMVQESYYGLGPVHQKEAKIYVQGITQKFGQNHKAEQWPSYVILTVSNSCVVRTEWISPGELSADILAATQLPYQRESYLGVHQRFDDFAKTQPVAKYYGGNWILIRNPENPDEPNQFEVDPSRSYRAKSSYPTYCLALTGSVLFDVITSPFQLIGSIMIHEAFKGLH